MREVSWDQAVSVAAHSFSRLPLQRVLLPDAVNRILVNDAISLCDLPAFDTSSMDGWAVSGVAPWTLMGEVITGSRPVQAITDGQCLAIATGGVIPEGTTSVIPWEQATEELGVVTGEIEPGANIRPSGMESRQGDVLVRAGSRITPPMVGLLAAAGHDSIEVTAQPRVAVFCLGDELIHTGIPRDGAIRDALGPALPALLSNLGAIVSSLKFVRDDLNELSSELLQVLDSVDLIVTTGGTADGPRDFIKPALKNLGANMLIDCVKVRPGYHSLLARVAHDGRDIPFLALPGNPQSALASLYSFGKPLIAALLGAWTSSDVRVELSSSLATPEGYARLVPGTVDGNLFTPSAYLGSAMLRGVAHSQGFALLEPGEHVAGAHVHWISF